MASLWTLGCDASDPHALAAFWALALGYVPEPGCEDADGASRPDLGHIVMLEPEGNEFCVA